MKFWLMVIICLPGHQMCTVKSADMIYPNATDCETATEAVLGLKTVPHLQGIFCELSAVKPKTYKVERGQIP